MTIMSGELRLLDVGENHLKNPVSSFVGGLSGGTLRPVLDDYAEKFAFGVGQPPQNVTASRSVLTTYQNTTDKTIFVQITGRGGGSHNVRVGPTSTPSEMEVVGTLAFSSGDPWGMCSFVVPPGYYYRVNNSANIGVWAEWRTS